MIPFLKYKKTYFILSGTLVLASLVSLIIFGLKPGIDFVGGSILEIEYEEERPSSREIKELLADFDLDQIQVQSSGKTGVILRMKDISEETHQEIIKKLGKNQKVEELRFETIGPVIGRELKEKTKILVILSTLAILIYITLAFRKVSRPIASWQYGIASLIALFHDVFIPLGVFSVLGNFYGVPITIPVITALLTVFGYSINNTVVVFDRIRENLIHSRTKGFSAGANFEEIVDDSLNQTLTRSLNTSLTTLFVLFAIFFFGGETLKYFALAFIIGLTCGTYSSVCLASPMLVSWLNWKKR